MSGYYKNLIKLTKNNLTNPASYIFPFKKPSIFDFSEDNKIKTFKQENGYNEFSSSEEKNDESLNLEQTLAKFYDYSLDCYKKKMYETLVKEIETNEYLYYIGSRESFDILILKIKCFMKMMMEEYDNDLNNGIDIHILTKEYILKIENEFLNLEKIINKKDPYEYEIITESYCKFLIYLIKFAQKREEYCKSMAYISLGINMIKIFFIKRQMTTKIKLYKRYIYLLLLLINQLIGEKNFKNALLYSKNLLKVIETAIKIIYWCKPKDNKKAIINKPILEIFRYIGFTYIYIGICFENQKNLEMAMEAYKESLFFFMKTKSPIFINIRKKNTKYSYDNNFIKVAHLFFNNQKLKIEEEKKRKEENISINDVIKKKNEQKKEFYEKRNKLKLISNGLYGNQNKFKQIENKIYKNILTPKNNIIINKLDKALISLAYSEKNIYQKKSSFKKELSLSIMDNLCHYKLYDILMSNKYQEFILTNNNLKLSNPKDQEEFIQEINSYLTSTMKIKPHNDKKNNQTKNNKEDIIQHSLSSGNIFINKKDILSDKTPNKLKSKNTSIFNFTNKKNQIIKKLLFKKNNSFASLKLDINKFDNNLKTRTINKSLSETYITSRTINRVNSKSKYNSRTKTKINSYKTYYGKISKMKNDEKKNYFLNPKYFYKYMHLDKLTKKELDFQKVILNLKSNNSKLYYNDFLKELYTKGKNKEEEDNQNYLIITEKINDKVLKNQKEYEKMIKNNQYKKRDAKNYKYLLKVNKEEVLFKNNKNNGGGYLDYDFFNYKKKSKIDYNEEEEKDPKKINEKSIFSLDEKIKNIRNKIKERKNLLKHH